MSASLTRTSTECGSGESNMTISTWMVLGLMIGLLASKRFRHASGAVALDVALGVEGAVAGGFAIDWLGMQPPAVYSVLRQGRPARGQLIAAFSAKREP
jgi:uncharacterized membrane protein YeaQ/YmgE (transglycosylase-associated protein family)